MNDIVVGEFDTHWRSKIYLKKARHTASILLLGIGAAAVVYLCLLLSFAPASKSIDWFIWFFVGNA